jgi:hypothetical protein
MRCAYTVPADPNIYVFSLCDKDLALAFNSLCALAPLMPQKVKQSENLMPQEVTQSDSKSCNLRI